MYPRISWSSLKRFEECPQKFKLYREKKRKPIKESWVIRGNVLHFSLEQILTGRPKSLIVEDAMRDHARMVEEARNLGWDEGEIAESEGMVRQGAAKLVELMEEYDHSGWVSELRIFKFYKDWCLEGIIDAWDPALPEVFDLKTGSWDHGQMVFYSVLHATYFGEYPRKTTVIEPLGRGMVDVVITPDEIRDMKDRIQRAVLAIGANDFPTSGFPEKCSWCPSARWCPAQAKTREGRLA